MSFRFFIIKMKIRYDSVLYELGVSSIVFFIDFVCIGSIKL